MATLAKLNGIALSTISKINGVSRASLAKINGQSLVINYSSVHPPDYTIDYIKATIFWGAPDFYAHHTANPALSLTGVMNNNQWMSNVPAEMRWQIQHSSGKVFKRMYYENSHSEGAYTNCGVKDFILQGSNSAASFEEVTYGIDTGWTQITTAQSTLDQHSASDAADPKYILLTNSVSYLYMAMKCATNWGGPWMGIRRLMFQEEI